jgi:hypothetical protein
MNLFIKWSLLITALIVVIAWIHCGGTKASATPYAIVSLGLIALSHIVPEHNKSR